jgi:hypothetical protein
VRASEGLEVDESLPTGKSDPVAMGPGGMDFADDAGRRPVEG